MSCPREQVLIPGELAEMWHTCLNPPLPLQGSLIQTWEVRCLQNVSQQRKLDHNCKEEVKRCEEGNCWGRDHQGRHQEDRRARLPSLNVSSCISIRTGGLSIPNPQNLKLKMLPSPRLFWALTWLHSKFYSCLRTISHSERRSIKMTCKFTVSHVHKVHERLKWTSCLDLEFTLKTRIYLNIPNSF